MSQTAPASLRSILLPAEHGGWGFTLEPVLLGLLVAPSPAGWLLGVFALFLFLAHRPTRLLLVDARRRRVASRTRVAALAVAGYLTAAAAALGGALLTADHEFWAALAAAVPLVVLQGWYEARSRIRALGRELTGPVAAGALAPAIALADGWGVRAAAGLWVVLAVRAVVSVLLVRAQIARVHGRSVRRPVVLGAHLAGASLAIGAAAFEVIPRLAAAALSALALWAVVALRLPPVRAVVVGTTQMAIGVVVVLLTATGHWVDW